MINTPTTHWTNNIKLGKRKNDNSLIWLYAPTFDCDWYWSFGYLGNKNEHYHLSGYANGRNISMRDALLTDYALNPKIKENLWVFCELVLTIYQLKNTAEVLGRGGSHYTTNPCKDIILDTATTARLNHVVIPKCLDSLCTLISD